MVRAGRARGATDLRGCFRRLAAEGLLDDELAGRLARAVGFRNLVVHAYADLDLDLARVHETALDGPADLVSFAAALLRAEGLPPS